MYAQSLDPLIHRGNADDTLKHLLFIYPNFRAILEPSTRSFMVNLTFHFGYNFNLLRNLAVGGCMK